MSLMTSYRLVGHENKSYDIITRCNENLLALSPILLKVHDIFEKNNAMLVLCFSRLHWRNQNWYLILLFTPYGIVTPYGIMDYCQSGFKQWPVAWHHQAIIWSNVDFSSVGSCNVHMKVIELECSWKESLQHIWKWYYNSTHSGQWVKIIILAHVCSDCTAYFIHKLNLTYWCQDNVPTVSQSTISN